MALTHTSLTRWLETGGELVKPMGQRGRGTNHRPRWVLTTGSPAPPSPAAAPAELWDPPGSPPPSSQPERQSSRGDDDPSGDNNNKPSHLYDKG